MATFTSVPSGLHARTCTMPGARPYACSIALAHASAAASVRSSTSARVAPASVSQRPSIRRISGIDSTSAGNSATSLSLSGSARAIKSAASSSPVPSGSISSTSRSPRCSRSSSLPPTTRAWRVAPSGTDPPSSTNQGSPSCGSTSGGGWPALARRSIPPCGSSVRYTSVAVRPISSCRSRRLSRSSTRLGEAASSANARIALQSIRERALTFGEPAEDGERRPVRRALKELDVLVVKRSRGQRAHVQHPDHASLHEQRHAEQRAEPLLAQDRVDDLELVDVEDANRPAGGGDAAGESAPHPGAHPPPDLLLEALRSPGDECCVVVLEQEDCRGVHCEDRHDAGEQLLEELLHRQVREGGIRDALEVTEPVGGDAGSHCAPILARRTANRDDVRPP